MSSKHGVLCYKIVTLEQIDVDKMEFPEISDTVRRVIMDAKVDSLQGLLGNNWHGESRKLAKEYLGIK